MHNVTVRHIPHWQHYTWNSIGNIYLIYVICSTMLNKCHCFSYNTNFWIWIYYILPPKLSWLNWVDEDD